MSGFALPDCLAVSMDLRKPCLSISIAQYSNLESPVINCVSRSRLIHRMAPQYDHDAASSRSIVTGRNIACKFVPLQTQLLYDVSG